MDTKRDSEPSSAKNRTAVQRTSERELVVARTFNGPAHLVYEAWTNPDLIQRWWVPKSFGASFLSCEIDARRGGAYRFVFSHASSEEPLAFFGKYLEAVPESRLVWTNEESGEGGPITTVTFEERGGETLVATRDVYSSKGALAAAIASGATGGYGESYEQLDALLISLGASTTWQTLRGEV
jgi:uncharacterized protein YndB with AHSA1/START domain